MKECWKITWAKSVEAECFTVYPVDAESKSFFLFWLSIKIYHSDIFLLLLSGSSREPCLRDLVYIKQEMERKTVIVRKDRGL